MSWKSIAEKKYSKGIRNLAEESQHFLDLLNSFNSRMNLKTEGKPFYINSVGYIRPDGVPVMMLKFVAKYKSGEIKIEDGSITDHVWVNKEEIKNYDCIDGIKEEVTYAISLFKR